MKYTLFPFIFLSIFFISFSVKSLSFEEQIQTQDQDFANLQANSVVGTIKPYKLKFCKSVGNNHELSTFTVLKNQSCSLMRYDSTTFNSKMFRGKKISKQNYIKQNPDFSEQSNLICISDESIFFITHTPSNKVYLNSILSRKHYLGDKKKKDYDLSKIDFNDLSWLNNNNISNGFLRDSKLTHQGIPTFSISKYVFNFENYYGEDKGVQHGVIDGPYLTIDNKYKNDSPGLRCYASKKYWQTMFVDKGIEINSSASIIAQNTYYQVNSTVSHNSAGSNEQNEVTQVTTQSLQATKSQSNSEQVSQETEVVQTKLDKKSLKEELQYWKELFQDELITQAEYDAKRKELLSGASVTTTTTVAEPKVEKKKVVAQTTVVENNTNTIDLSFKDKNYINRSLLDKMGFFSNDGKIKDYCEDKYPKLHVYMECYAQNVKKYRNYKRAAEVYDLYIDYGRYLAWEAMIGNMSESSARYQLSAKRKELGDAYAAESRDKWNRIADSMEQLRKTHESFQPKPLYGSGESTNVCMYNAEEEAMKICRRKLNNGTCAQFSFEGC